MSTKQKTSPDGTSRNGRSPRVLIIADDAIGEPTASYLRSAGYNVTVPRLPNGTAEECASMLFPPRSPSGKAVDVSGHAPFFAWTAFDAVVLQDLWYDAANRRVVPFGCLLAQTDYYLRGNFQHPKVVMVTDPHFYQDLGTVQARCEDRLRGAFDHNAQIAFVPVFGNGSARRTLAAVEAAVSGHEPREHRAEVREAEAPEQRRAMRLLSNALRDYVTSAARVVIIDDSAKTIDVLAERFGHATRCREDALVHFFDVRERSVEDYRSFDELKFRCERAMSDASAAAEMLFIVTDILFDAVEWDGGDRKTGVDLIEWLRCEHLQSRTPIGIVGLTGVASPLVTTSASHRGADAVVGKAGQTGAPLHHVDRIDDNVMYKLLLTLGFLCFQRQFLASKRDVKDAQARRQLADLFRVLPSHVVSPHLQKEWTDTHYILEWQATYGRDATARAKQSIERIRQQYP